MAKYFPRDINISDISPPLAILRDAQSEWEEATGGALALDIDVGISDKGLSLISVRAVRRANDRSATLFRVTHRQDNPYPAAVIPEGEDLPTPLRKTYFQRGFPSLGGINAAVLASTMMNSEGKMSTNEWVADTPAEFRELLEKALTRGYAKGVILNLIASASLVQEGVEKSGK